MPGRSLYVDVDRMSRNKAVDAIVGWLDGLDDHDYDEYTAVVPDECVLNVAGRRESKAGGIQDLVMAILVDVLREVNEGCEGLYPVGGECEWEIQGCGGHSYKGDDRRIMVDRFPV